MTPEERAAKIVPLRFDFSAVCGGWPVPDHLRDQIAAAIRDAESAMKKQCIRYIHRQNALVNDLLGGSRHDAFVADITAGIGNLD